MNTCAGDSLSDSGGGAGYSGAGPQRAAAAAPAVLLIPLHFGAFFALLYITTQRPEMGNGGLYSFAYIYLTGNPVFGEALLRRGLLAVVGFVLCGGILLLKHRGQLQGHPFSSCGAAL